MGALNTKQQNWPDVITTLRCDRQRVYENILSTEACWDWFPEIKQVIPKRDGDVAPGMLCKTGFSDATDYIEMNDKAADKNGVGCYVEWTFYACGWGPAISENTHLWIKQNYDFKFKQQFFLTDCPGQPGARERAAPRRGARPPRARSYVRAHPLPMRAFCTRARRANVCRLDRRRAQDDCARSPTEALVPLLDDPHARDDRARADAAQERGRVQVGEQATTVQGGGQEMADAGPPCQVSAKRRRAADSAPCPGRERR